MRKVLLAKSAGFCFGVRRAVKLAQEIAECGAPYVMLGPVIHNDHVIAQLAAQGVGCVSSLEEVPRAAASSSAPTGRGRKSMTDWRPWAVPWRTPPV